MRMRSVSGREVPVAVARRIEQEKELYAAGERDGEMLRGVWAHGAVAGYYGGLLAVLDTRASRAYRAGYRFGTLLHADDLQRRSERREYTDILMPLRAAGRTA